MVIDMKFQKVHSLKGELRIPGDKSISHRAVMFASLAEGKTEVTNFLQGADCLSTIDCFRKLGVVIENTPDKIMIHGKGLHAFSPISNLTSDSGFYTPSCSTLLDVGNSGTTARLMSGILAAQPFEVMLTGDASIQKRPMKRIIEPLSMMGADITSVHDNGCAPLHIKGKMLHGIQYSSPVASAQVKSAILLAGLYAEGETSVTEPYVSRNHTELMLRSFGADIKTEGTTATIQPNPHLIGQQIEVPGDISSAAYFIAAGLLTPNSEVLIRHVGINETRDGIIEVARQMGGNITLLNIAETNGEKTADILVKSSSLHGVTIGGAIIPTLIDELPIIAVMAAFADGQTVIKDAAELKVKESNRIDVMVNNLSAMGADVTATEDGMIINGGQALTGCAIDSKSDHRIAMSFAVAGLNADGVTTIQGAGCVEISYPEFYRDLEKLYR